MTEIETIQKLPEGAMEWDEHQWMAHFDETRAICYAFDFFTPPKVRGDATGRVDTKGQMMLVPEAGCPVCDRPVVAMVRRWNNEDLPGRLALVEKYLAEMDWHNVHPQKKKAAPTA